MGESEKTSIIERVKFQTEIIKVLALFILALSTGVISLLLKEVINLKIYLVSFFGSVLILFFIFIVIFVYMNNIQLLRRLRDD